MKTTREQMADAIKRVVGPGKRFESARQYAQRAHTLGYADNVDSLARNITRLMKGEQDARSATADILARTAGATLSEFLSGSSGTDPSTNSSNSASNVPLSDESNQDYRNIVLARSLTHLSDEMRELVEHLIEIDQMGGAEKEMAIAGIRYILRGHQTVRSLSRNK